MKLTKEQLKNLLKNILITIDSDDSFEGRISYTCMDERVPCGKDEFEVDAFYRVGNSEGQGGAHIVEPTAKPEPLAIPERGGELILVTSGNYSDKDWLTLTDEPEAKVREAILEWKRLEREDCAMDRPTYATPRLQEALDAKVFSLKFKELHADAVIEEADAAQR